MQIRTFSRTILILIGLSIFSASAQAVELRLYVNEPQSDRCAKNISDATEALKEVSNVKLTITPYYQAPVNGPQAPAVVVDNEVLAENKGLHNGRLEKDEMVKALIANGAVPYSAGYRVIHSGSLKAMVEAGKDDFVLIDARNPEEYQEVHIPGAFNLPEKKFDEQKNLLPKKMSTTLIFYCNGMNCGTSKRLAVKAVAAGYKEVLIYSQGMVVWEELEFPITKGQDYDKKIETTLISPEDLKKLIDAKDKNYVLIDVREASDYKEARIPGAINIPVENFAARAHEIDPTKKIIVYCNSGDRSYLAYRKLMKLSYGKIYQTRFGDWVGAGMPLEM